MTYTYLKTTCESGDVGTIEGLCYKNYTKHVDFSGIRVDDILVKDLNGTLVKDLNGTLVKDLNGTLVKDLNDNVTLFKSTISKINEFKDDVSTSELMISSTQTLYAMSKSYKIILIIFIVCLVLFIILLQR